MRWPFIIPHAGREGLLVRFLLAYSSPGCFRKVYRTYGNVRPKPFVVVVVFGPLLRTPSTTESLGALGNPITRATRVVRSLGLRGGLSVLGSVHLKPGHHRTTVTLGHVSARARL